MKRIDLFLLLAPLLASLSGCQSAKPEDIVILYTNDVHCGYAENLGYSGVASLKKELQKQGTPTLLVDVGDAVQGDNYGSLSKGEASIALMNASDYDLATLGNHEFDYGFEQLDHLMDLADFPYICCNLTNLETHKDYLPPYLIKDIGNRKIGFLGIDTPTSLTESTPKYFQNAHGEFIYTFYEGEGGRTFYDRVQATVDSLKQEKVDYVIALAHLGGEDSVKPYRSKDLLANVSGIDVCLDGHSHEVMESEIVKDKQGKEVILSQTGTKLECIGKLSIGKDGSLKTELIHEYDGKDAEVDEIYRGIAATYSAKLDQVIGHAAFDLTILGEDGKRLVRSGETNLGDLTADAFKESGKADIGIVNGGGVRAGIGKGDITLNDVLKVFPFMNALAKVSMSGQEILDELEFSCYSLPGEFGGFLHASGLTYTVDLSIPSSVTLNDEGQFLPLASGVQRRVRNVKVAGEAIDPNKSYSVASNDYILTGGNGYPTFKNTRLPVEDKLDWEVLQDFFVAHPDLSAYANLGGDGRVEIVGR